jgi:CheY-like chemotaxis protein
MKILFIDDDKDDQILFCEAVVSIVPGLICDLASNGQEGIDRLESYTELPDLVFLDINMPLMDGWETLKLIRSTPRLKSLKVVIYSTSNQKSDRERFASLGAGFISKPTTFEGIILSISDVIHEAMGRKHRMEVLKNVSV